MDILKKGLSLLQLRQPVDEVINIIIRFGVKTYSIDLAHRVCIVNIQDQWKVPIFSPKTWDLVNLQKSNSACCLIFLKNSGLRKFLYVTIHITRNAKLMSAQLFCGLKINMIHSNATLVPLLVPFSIQKPHKFLATNMMVAEE